MLWSQLPLGRWEGRLSQLSSSFRRQVWSSVKRLDAISPKLLIIFDAHLAWCSSEIFKVATTIFYPTQDRTRYLLVSVTNATTNLATPTPIIFKFYHNTMLPSRSQSIENLLGGVSQTLGLPLYSVLLMGVPINFLNSTWKMLKFKLKSLRKVFFDESSLLHWIKIIH